MEPTVTQLTALEENHAEQCALEQRLAVLRTVEASLLRQRMPKTTSLMKIIPLAARQLIENPIITSMTVIDWGKAMARCNEIIQKSLLRYSGIEAYDPETDEDCPTIDTTNNSPGFDIVVVNHEGKKVLIQSKLRQVRGITDFSQQTHFETTRRHSEKNKGASSDSGHVAYGCNEFDFVMISLINVGKNGDIRKNRNTVDNWSFSIIPIKELIDKEKNCCFTHIPAKLLEKYQYKIDPTKPPIF